MNKKITVRRGSDNKERYCILPSGDLQKQFNIFLFHEEYPSGGYSARCDGKTLEIIDYISYDTVTTFEILSIEDTDQEPREQWLDAATGKTGWN